MIQFPTSSATPQERELIRRLTTRDTAAITLFYERYGAMLYRVILRLVKHPVLAENVLQESLATIWYDFDTFDATQHRLFPWALMICRSKAQEELQSHERYIAECVNTRHAV
ncbi:RNA polymerase sigma factor [Hymenobacter cavernae]|uniref:RNA polymerase sigma-70 region 2 domain-containing protein n=1 Tax=Hymenobacter cavernae TaxID=2044852 RepID=A0ABQ1U1B0_9BACT|nr:sigma factor [Hymenobacter cavernae]GGF08658.1 hypothetical protein GCM10011383_19770 [Hymenobacter cavernae]